MDNSTSNRLQNDPLKGKDEEEETILGFSPEFDTFPLLLAIFVAALNFLILFLTAKVKSLRTVTNLILGSLAVSDLLSGVLGLPLYLVCSAIQKTVVCAITQMLTRFLSISIVLHLLLVSVDRHIAVVHAIRYRSLVTKRRILSLLLSVWSTAIFVALIQLSWLRLDINVNEDSYEKTAIINIIYDIFCIILFFLAPLITMIFCYTTIFLALRQQLRAIKKNNVGLCFKMEQRRSHSREKRAAMIFLSMIAVYIICWLPYFLLDLQHQFGNDFFSLPVSVEYAVFYYPKFLNSVLDPLLYVYRKHDFRQAVQALLGRSRASRKEGPSLSLRNTYGITEKIRPSHDLARGKEGKSEFMKVI